MNKSTKLSPSGLKLLECTIRDGSYAVNFKFTLNDTAVLAHILSKMGFRYIEVGHGLGLGASRAGKGDTSWSDKEAIETAKNSVFEKSLIGVFCIPGIANYEDIHKAKDVGLNFIRIGENAQQIENTLPYLEKALQLDIIPMVNFMKSYTLSPNELAKKAKVLSNAGAKVIYVVDSAGGMFPEEVASYVKAIRENIHENVEIGFHGHSNLGLVVANCLEVIKQGANFIDTTLYGLGRSAGNAPTEVMVAVLKKLGYGIGDIDLFEVMDVVEQYIQPLTSRIQMYDMMSVAAGYSLFHSSYLPKVLRVAEKYGVEIKRLVAAIGKADPANCSDDILEEMANTLSREVKRDKVKDFSLVDFHVPGISHQKITNTLKTMNGFINGLEATASKIYGISILDVVPLSTDDENLALSEFILQDDKAVIGRVYCGGKGILRDVLKISRGKIKWIIADIDNNSWITPEGLLKIVKDVWSIEDISLYSSYFLQTNYILKVILRLIKLRNKSLLIFGRNKLIESIYDRLLLYFNEVHFYEDNFIKDVDAILCFSNPDPEHLEKLLNLIKPGGFVIVIDKIFGSELTNKTRERGIKFFEFSTSEAYRGFASQLLSIEQDKSV